MCLISKKDNRKKTIFLEKWISERQKKGEQKIGYHTLLLTQIDQYYVMI